MDFSTTEASDDLGGLVRTITESVCTPEHQRELDGLGPQQGGRFDDTLWRKLIDWSIAALAPVCGAVFVSGHAHAARESVPDRPRAGLGPLGGLAGALTAACDAGCGDRRRADPGKLEHPAHHGLGQPRR